MRAIAKLMVPDEAKVEVRLVMSVKEMRDLRECITSDAWPGWPFKSILSRCMEQACEHFIAEEEHTG